MSEGSSIADIRPHARSNFFKLVGHVLIDLTAYCSYYPVLMLLFFYKTNSYSLISVANIGYGVAAAIVLVTFGPLQQRLHQKVSLGVTIAAAIVMIALCATSAFFAFNWILDIAAVASIGVYMSSYQMATATIVCDSIDVTNPDADLNLQFIAQACAPLIATGVTMAMFAGLGNEWSEDIMRIIILATLGVQLLAQGLLFSLKDLRMPPMDVDLGTNSVSETQPAQKGNELPHKDSVNPLTVIPTCDNVQPSENDVVETLVLDGSPGPSPRCETVATDDVFKERKPSESVKQNSDDDSRHTLLRESFVVPVLAACSVICYSIGEMMCWQYFSYFATSELGLNPIQFFALLLVELSVKVCVATGVGFLADKFPSTRIVGTVQVLAPLAMWFLVIWNDSISTLMFLVAVVIHSSMRDGCLGLCRGIIVRYATPNARLFWNGLGWEGARSLSSLIGVAIGGTVTEAHGFRFVLLPAACVMTAGWMFSLCLIFATPKDDTAVTEEEKLEENLARHNMTRVLASRAESLKRNFGTFMAIKRAHRSFLKLVHIRRQRKASGGVTNVTSFSNDGN